MSELRGLFSSSYWALHRNTLLFSFALLIVSLPGVNLDPSQTVIVFQLEHLVARALKWAIAVAALYSFLAYVLEWRHEAYAFYLTERGLLEDRQGQVGAVVEAIQEQIRAAAEHQREALRHLGELKAMVVERRDHTDRAVEESAGRALATIEIENSISDTIKKIKRQFEKVVQSTTIEIDRNSIADLINHPEIEPRIRNYIVELSSTLLSRNTISSLEPDAEAFDESAAKFIIDQQKSVEASSNISKPLEVYEKSLRGLRRGLLTQKLLASARVWLFGFGAAAVLFVVAIAHFVGSEMWVAMPPITALR